MNILLVAREFPPTVGGMQVHAVQIARFLARRHRVAILAPAFPGVPDRIDSIPVIRTLSERFGTSLAAVLRAVRETRADVVFALNAGYATVGRFTTCPVLTRVVGNDFYASWVGPHLPLRFLFWRLPVDDGAALGTRLRRRDQRFRNAVVAWGLNSNRRILANSQFTQRALQQAGVRRPQITVQVGGVDLSTFTPGSASAARSHCGLPETHILTTSATLKAKKGIDTALQAVHLVTRKRNDLLYLVLGSGEDEPTLRRLATDLDIDPFVRFLGTKPHDELPIYLTASDIYVQCSRTATDPVTGCVDVETMGRAACEASSCGIPVIATTSGGLPDVVQDGTTGLLVPEDDPAALAQAISRLLDDAPLRTRLGSAGAAHARAHFGWETIGAHTEQCLLEAAAAA